MSAKGDFQRLKELSASLRKASRMAHRQVLTAFAVDVAHQVDRGFLSSRSPYGEGWAPLKSRVGMPLLDLGILRSSVKARRTTTGIQVTSNLVYAGTHNYGRGPIPKRQFLPDAQRGLPPLWVKMLRARADDVQKQLGLLP